MNPGYKKESDSAPPSKRMSGTRPHRPAPDASAQSDLICAPPPIIIDQTQAAQIGGFLRAEADQRILRAVTRFQARRRADRRSGREAEIGLAPTLPHRSPGSGGLAPRSASSLGPRRTDTVCETISGAPIRRASARRRHRVLRPGREGVDDRYVELVSVATCGGNRPSMA